MDRTGAYIKNSEMRPEVAAPGGFGLAGFKEFKLSAVISIQVGELPELMEFLTPRSFSCSREVFRVLSSMPKAAFMLCPGSYVCFDDECSETKGARVELFPLPFGIRLRGRSRMKLITPQKYTLSNNITAFWRAGQERSRVPPPFAVVAHSIAGKTTFRNGYKGKIKIFDIDDFMNQWKKEMPTDEVGWARRNLYQFYQVAFPVGVHLLHHPAMAAMLKLDWSTPVVIDEDEFERRITEVRREAGEDRLAEAAYKGRVVLLGGSRSPLLMETIEEVVKKGEGLIFVDGASENEAGLFDDLIKKSAGNLGIHALSGKFEGGSFDHSNNPALLAKRGEWVLLDHSLDPKLDAAYLRSVRNAGVRGADSRIEAARINRDSLKYYEHVDSIEKAVASHKFRWWETGDIGHGMPLIRSPTQPGYSITQGNFETHLVSVPWQVLFSAGLTEYSAGAIPIIARDVSVDDATGTDFAPLSLLGMTLVLFNFPEQASFYVGGNEVAPLLCRTGVVNSWYRGFSEYKMA